MRSIPLGAKGSFTLVVTPARLASQFKDATLPPVLATPVMIMAMENAALNAIRPFLEPSETALGTVVDVRHLAATPVGQRVSAHDETEEIGRGTHQRMIVDYARIERRLAAKRKP
jgi:fluoroacetyl-CoA thioesterase